MASTRCGISAKQIERETGVTYKTAWRMFKQIRSMLEENEPIGGKGRDVETDEAFFGGMRKGGGGRRLWGALVGARPLDASYRGLELLELVLDLVELFTEEEPSDQQDHEYQDQ